MKSKKLITLLALGSAFGLLVGCGQKEQTAPAPPARAEKAMDLPAAPIPKPAEAPAPTAMAAPEAVPDQAQSLIDKIKDLLAEKKYPEALAALKELSAMKLTADQQTMVDGLKAQVEKALQAQATSEATKSVGGLLGK